MAIGYVFVHAASGESVDDIDSHLVQDHEDRQLLLNNLASVS